MNLDDPKATLAGEPYRGESKVELRPESISIMGRDVKPVEAVIAGGNEREIPSIAKGGEGLGMAEGVGGIWEEL